MTTDRRWVRHWQRKATFLQRIIDHLRADLQQAYKDYDQVEAELKEQLKSCTCRKEITK